MTSASGGRMSTSAFECRRAMTQEVVWLWREVCAGIKKVYMHPIINSGNFWSGDQCSGQAHKISAWPCKHVQMVHAHIAQYLNGPLFSFILQY